MTKVLIVDDNELYRSAFKRNLLLQNYDVVEAENSDEALRVYNEEKPDIVITDLAMRSSTEGLELIKTIKQAAPLTPVVLISAVGTFEEGSKAKELGAEKVLMKQKIDEQIEDLYTAIEEAEKSAEKFQTYRKEIEELIKDPENVSSHAADRLRQLTSIPNQHPVVLADAYEALTKITEFETRKAMQEKLSGNNNINLSIADATLNNEIPEFDKLAPESVKELRTAEYFFQQQGGDTPQGADFSRNIGFSYCFAVENEAKARLRKKIAKFLSDGKNIKLIRNFIDPRTHQLDLFYHQHLLRLQQQYPFEFTIDNVKQVFDRILEHEARYKPDGLKALGIMIVCFGRTYQVKTIKANHRISNPMNLKGFNSEEEILNFAQLLVSLQHYRNPYIHPEISEMEKISKIRETAIDCLKYIARLN